MANEGDDPWARWYAGYCRYRAALKAAAAEARARQRTSNLLAGLLVAYMLVGGLAASIAIGLVMAN